MRFGFFALDSSLKNLVQKSLTILNRESVMGLSSHPREEDEEEEEEEELDHRDWYFRSRKRAPNEGRAPRHCALLKPADKHESA